MGKLAALKATKTEEKECVRSLLTLASMSIPVFSLRLFPTYVPIFHML